MKMKTGIDVLLQSRLNLLRGADVGAVVHPASILSDWRHTADALAESKGFRLVSLFGPQHGARGEKQANMIESGFYLDPDLGLPVNSLYGSTRIPTEEMMQNIDMLLFDLQDVGTRVYTFIHTMANCMEACARFGKQMVVLDRPNPVTGSLVEGNILQKQFRSFVGLHPVPMRHGMTAGELALLFNAESDIRCDLTVVEMEGWNRNAWFDQTGLHWIQPSPNLPSLESTTVYPGMVLFEGTQISEGRGTTRPFEFIGAPFVESRQYAAHLNRLNLEGVYFRPVFFQPTFDKWEGNVCGGVQVHVTDRDVFKPYITGIAALAGLRSMYAEEFEWLKPPYEYEYEKMPIEIICGCREIPEMIEQGVSLDKISQYCRQGSEQFEKTRAPYLLYS